MEKAQEKYIRVDETSIEELSVQITKLGYTPYFKADHTDYCPDMKSCLQQHFSQAEKHQVSQFPVRVENYIDYSGLPGVPYHTAGFVFDWNRDAGVYLDKLELVKMSEANGSQLIRLDLHIYSDQHIPAAAQAKSMTDHYHKLIQQGFLHQGLQKSIRKNGHKKSTVSIRSR